MELCQLLLITFGASCALFTSAWVLSLIRRDAGIADLFWGAGFVVIAWISWGLGDASGPRALVLVALVSIWGVRLSTYLSWRNLGKPEDYRYAAMREKHGERFALRSLVTVFLLQGVLAWLISWPVQIGSFRATGWSAWATVGVGLWLIGLLFESVGDFQLARFKANPQNRGQVMNRGLWRYTRHPNYFGDFLVWWGFFLVGFDAASWWWTILGPLLMSFLLIRVSGVHLLESSLRTRITGYEEYVQRTSAFFPLPPKRNPA